MNAAERIMLEDTADALDEFRRTRLCCYGAEEHGPCDCKFPLNGKGSSEVTGCPELRSLVARFRLLAGAEDAENVRRAHLWSPNRDGGELTRILRETR